METMELQLGRREEQLKHWGTKLDLCLVKADEFGAGAKSDYRRRVEELRAKYQIVQDKLEELKAASSERWDTLRGEVESAWHEFETSLTRLTTY